jgi:hypothetical protein
VVASLTAATTGSQRHLELKLVASLVTQQMTAQRAAPEASSMLQDLMTAHQSASGQISHAPEDQPTTARKKRAGQTDLLITTPAVQIQEASVSQHHVLTVLGNLVPQELTDLLLTDHTQSETHQTAEQEATTEQIVQQDLTQTVRGNLAHRAPTDLLLTDHTQSETHQTAEQEATTALTALQTDRHVRTLTVRGKHVLQELIDQSAQVTHVVLQLVQTLASLIVTATHSARTAFQGIVQEMTASSALATRTQTRKLSSKTRF